MKLIKFIYDLISYVILNFINCIFGGFELITDSIKKLFIRIFKRENTNEEKKE